MNSYRKIRVIISGGGTGGHIFPAIAIARGIQRRTPDAEILFVGAEGRMEMEKVPAAGFKIEGLWISGLQRNLSLQNLLFPFKVMNSIAKARKIIKEFKPDVVIGVGGYASGPLLYAASGMGIPCLIQEQNSFAGLTNKWLGSRVQKICVAFDGMEQFFPKEKILKTGNPVRNDLLDVASLRDEALKHFELDPARPVLLVIGGSLGARTLNHSMAAAQDKIERAGIQVIWQTGKGFFAEAKKFENKYLKVYDFISRMDLAYAAADVVVSRAGAISIAELCVTGKPAILVPSPHVAEDHQTKNALALSSKKAALLVKDSEARTQLVDKAIALIFNQQHQQQLAENIKALAIPDATERIVNEINSLLPA